MFAIPESQAYIMTHLGYENPDALKELVFLLASKWDGQSDLDGEGISWQPDGSVRVEFF